MKKIIALYLLIGLPTAHAFVPKEAYFFDYNIQTVKMGWSKQKKIYNSAELLKMIVSSPEFRSKILRHRYKGRYAFAENRGLKNAQIYRKILEGAERLSPYRNNTLDVEVELYTNFNSNVMGYTMPRSRRIWMNTKYFSRYSAGELASHLTHEWLHKLGFDHDKERTHRRKFTVPYAIGYIVRDLAKEYEY
jgi:hypothetical protein